MNLARLLFQTAENFPDRPAVSLGERRLYDYGAYGALAARLAGGLRGKYRLRPGDRVALAMTNNPEYLALLFAIWRAGLVAVPVNARLHPREIAYIAADCGAALCFATVDLADGLAPVLPANVRLIVLGADEWRALASAEPCEVADVRPEDAAWIFYTSGTTGRPKGAILTHRNLLAMTVGYLADVDRLTPDDCLIHMAAQSHATGLFGLSHIAKATHHILPESGGFDPGELGDLLRLYDSATLFVPPTGLRRLLHDPVFDRAPVERMRSLLLGAAPVYLSDLKAGYDRFGPRLWNGYGQGESPCTITAMSKEMLAEAMRAGDLDRIGVIDAVHFGALQNDLRLDLHGAQRGGGVGGKIRIPGAADEDHRPSLLQMADGPAADERLRHLVHLDGAHQPRADAPAFQRILHGQTVDDRGQHAHVVGRHAVHLPRLQRHAAEKIAPAQHQRHLHAQLLHAGDFRRQIPHPPRIHAKTLASGQSLAGELEQDPVVGGRGHGTGAARTPRRP